MCKLLCDYKVPFSHYYWTTHTSAITEDIDCCKILKANFLQEHSSPEIQLFHKPKQSNGLTSLVELAPGNEMISLSNEIQGWIQDFFRRGRTTNTNTNKPHFFCRVPVVLESRRSSQGKGGWLHTSWTHPIEPPLKLILEYLHSTCCCPLNLISRPFVHLCQ